MRTADGSEFTPAMREDGIALCSRHGCPLFDVAAGNPQDLFRCSRTGPDTMPICMPWARLLLATVNERAFGGAEPAPLLPEKPSGSEIDRLRSELEAEKRGSSERHGIFSEAHGECRRLGNECARLQAELDESYNITFRNAEQALKNGLQLIVYYERRIKKLRAEPGCSPLKS